MVMSNRIVPKKFLFCYSLSTGAIVASVVLISSHGKGSADRVGAVIKRTADAAVAQGRDVVTLDGFLKICVTLVFAIGLIVQVMLMKDCVSCTQYVWRNAYGFSVTGVIYCFIMLAMHAWVLWGIKERKAAVLLSWVVVTAMWLSQTLFLLITLICIHSTDNNFIAWILCLVFGLVAIGILIYFVLVVYGFWIEVNGARKVHPNIQVATDDN